MTNDPLPSSIPAEPPSAAYRYGWSMGIVILVTLIRIPLEPYLEPSGFILSLAGVFVAAWVGGFWASLPMQTFVFAAEYIIFRRTEEIFLPTLRSMVHIASFYMIGSTVGLLSDFMHAAQRRANAQRNEAMAQRNRLRTTLACMADGVIATDAQGRVTLINPAAETILGRTAADSLELPVDQVFALCGVDDQPLPNPVLALLGDGSLVHQAAPAWLCRQEGSRLPIAYNAAVLEDEPGKTAGVVVAFRDESLRERTTRALREADRRKDEFLATLAHELRNPLAPISTGLEVMKLSLHDPAATEELRSMMERQTRHMVRLVDDLLDVSRITRGRIELRKLPADLEAVVRNAVDAVQPMIDQADHELTVKLPSAPVKLVVDSNRLSQILSNLLANAAKFTPPGGRIELAATECDDQILLTVTDNGPGVVADQRENIFEMFAQASPSDEGTRSGLGIGLTLVKQLVELHGGQVEVESPGPGGGSRFTVALPHSRAIDADPPKPAAPSAAARPASASSRRRVLVVDDNEDALRTLSKMVQILGNESYEARDGLEAVEAAEKLQPDIVLMDLGMPRLDGIAAAQRIRQEPWGKELLLVATTGWGQDEDRRRTKEAGFDHHLVKPVEVVVLKSLLDGDLVQPSAAR